MRGSPADLLTVLDGRYLPGHVVQREPGVVRMCAVDLETGQRVGLTLARSAVRPDAVVDEARSLALLGHPHVLPIVDLRCRGIPVYSVHAPVVGPAMAHPIGWPQALELADAALTGLAHAHDRGVMHGAPSASYLLLSPNGQPMLAGFAGRGDPTSDVRGVVRAVLGSRGVEAVEEQDPGVWAQARAVRAVVRRLAERGR